MPSTRRIASVNEFRAFADHAEHMTHALIDERFGDDVSHGSLHNVAHTRAAVLNSRRAPRSGASTQRFSQLVSESDGR